MAEKMSEDSPQAVTVTLDDLKAGTVSFDALKEAFGPTSLGILLVKGLPQRYADLRHRLLSYASYLANLPDEELGQLECPQAKWLIGWSRGRETLKNGVYDTLKGSYYVNCAFYKDPALTSASGDYPSFPEYTAPNIWPAETLLPGFRSTFMELCTLIIDTAVLVARACDRYAESTIEDYKPGCLEAMVKSSTTTKARLLHYFPPAPTTIGTNEPPIPSPQQDTTTTDDWCATHTDHGCLTGLTSAMYINETLHPATINLSSSSSSSSPLPPPPLPSLPRPPSTTTGLYILSRTHTTVQVNIPEDHLAFQTGLALERITRGRFKAVPHFVRGLDGAADQTKTAGPEQAAIARNTLAVFTQPNLDDLLDPDTDFASFARAIVEKNH